MLTMKSYLYFHHEVKIELILSKKLDEIEINVHCSSEDTQRWRNVSIKQRNDEFSIHISELIIPSQTIY